MEEITDTARAANFFENLGIDPLDVTFHDQIAEFFYAMGKKFYPDHPWNAIYNAEKLERVMPDIEEISARYNVKFSPELIKEFELEFALAHINNLDDHMYSKKMMDEVVFLDTLRTVPNLKLIQELIQKNPNLARDHKLTSRLLRRGLFNQLKPLFEGIGLSREELDENYGEDYPLYTTPSAFYLLSDYPTDIIEFLLDNGMQIPKTSEFMDILDPVFGVWSNEALSPIVKQAARDLARWLLRKGFPPTSGLVQRLAEAGEKQLLTEMLARANLTPRDRFGGNFFHRMAEWYGPNVEMWHFIREKLAETLGEAKVQELLNQPNGIDHTPVMMARPNTLEYYLRENVDLTYEGFRNKTALHGMIMRDPELSAQMLRILMDWVEKTYFPDPNTTVTDAAWRRALNQAGKALNVKAKFGTRMGQLTSVLAETIRMNDEDEWRSEANRTEARNTLMRALQLLILMGAPTDMTEVQENCGDAYEECGQMVKKAYDFRQRIESAYLNRPFAPNDPLFPISRVDKDAARLARGRLREQELCAKLSRELDVPELLALAKYVDYEEAKPSLSKREICLGLAQHMSQGGRRFEARAPVAKNPAVDDFLDAIVHRDMSKIRGMIELGHDPNEKDDEFTLPLFLAISGQSEDVIELLLQAGADPLAKDSNGTPVSIFGYGISGWDTTEGRDRVDALLRAKVSDKKAYLYQLFLGQLVDLLTVPTVSVDDVKNELETFSEYGVRFSPEDKVFDKTLIEWVDDEEYGGEKPASYPHEELKKLLRQYFQ